MNSAPAAPAHELFVEGYAALFGVVDRMRDIVRAGAFARSLARSEPLPMLVEHEPRALAGYWSAHEDARGLFVRGAVDDALPGAARARRLLARGAEGLSIGFIPIVASREGAVRVLEHIELLEVSVVTHPMQPLARLVVRRQRPILAAA